MKWGKKDIGGAWSYWFDWKGKITLEDCWNAVLLLSKLGKVHSILAVELHDASDVSMAGMAFGNAKEFLKWASEQEDAPEYDGGYELDHAEVVSEVDGEAVKMLVSPLPLWASRETGRTDLLVTFEAKDRMIGEKLANEVKRIRIGGGA